MFFNLAYRNAKRSRKENLIYFLTLVVAVASFYVILSLREQDVIRFLGEIESEAVSKLIAKLLPTVFLCALLFVFFLVIFANNYQLECRSRELGLYLLFGMTKKRLFLQLMTETLISSLLALITGMMIGGFVSEIISLTTARLIGQGIIAHHVSISFFAVVWTSVGFLALQALALSILSKKLFRREINQLLLGDIAQKQKSGSVHGGILTFIAGIATLLCAYWIALKHLLAVGGAMLFVAAGLGIVGSILFIRGFARLLHQIAGARKNKQTHGLYSFTLRQLQENITSKYLSVGVASLLMTLTIMLIADGSATIMSYRDHLTRDSAVYDFTIMGEDETIQTFLASEKMQPYVAHINRMEIGNVKSPDKDSDNTSLLDWSMLREKVVQNLPDGVADPAAQQAVSYEIGPHISPALNLLAFIDTGGMRCHLIPLSAYNQLLLAGQEEEVDLKHNEAIFYLNSDYIGGCEEILDLLNQIIKQADGNLLKFDGKIYQLRSDVPMKGLTADVNTKIFTGLIVSDEVFEQYVDPETCMTYWSFCIPRKMTDAKGLLSAVMEVNERMAPSGLQYESYLNNFGRQLFHIISGSYTTLYMGFMILIISCALLALQFLIQMQATKKRYLTLTALGAPQRQLRKSLHSQIFGYFALPIILACVNSGVGLQAMQINLHSSVTNDGRAYPLIIIMSVVIVFVLCIYALAVARIADKEISRLTWKSNL